VTGSRLSIVHVFRAPLGGLFRHVIDLAGEQCARGHRVGLFFDSGGRDERVDAAIAGLPGGLALGVAGAAIDRQPGFGDLIGFLSFRRWLAGVAPDVIHGHGAKGGLFARGAGALSPAGSRPIVAYTPHGGSFNYRVGSLSHTIYMRAERTLARATDLFLFESDFIAERFDLYVGEVAGLRRRAYNGLKRPEFKPVVLDRDAAELLYIGELREAKGVDTLIRAVAAISARRPIRLAVVGSGPDRDAFEAQARQLGLADRIVFHGPLPARRAFALGHVLVVPSRQESLPYIVLEAAASGKPIVATSVGGIPEIFGPYAGRLVATDDAGVLAAAITSMLDEDAVLRERASEGLQAYVDSRFSVSTMADAALAAYAEAIQRRRALPAASARRLKPEG
jgi:glycosyltransferase involved in cell wall biosynthesis